MVIEIPPYYLDTLGKTFSTNDFLPTTNWSNMAISVHGLADTIFEYLLNIC
jgi:hypothetical protein